MFAEYFQQKVNEAIDAAQDAVKNQIEAKLEQICIAALGRLFARVVSDLDINEKRYRNAWVGRYEHQPISFKYAVKKARWGGRRDDYFKARHYFSKRNKKLNYPYKDSLYATFAQLSKDPSMGKFLYQASGGVGLGVKTSGVDLTKGRIVDGKPKKFGKNKYLVNARWQDIVSKEWLSKTSRTNARFKLPEGYYRSDNPNKIVTPKGTSISRARAIATGIITLNTQGKFFENIKQNEQGFLNFLLRIQLFDRSRSADRDIAEVLAGLAKQGRHILDPVFGEILDEIDEEFDDYIETL